MKKLFGKIGKRTVALLLAMLMVMGMVPVMWLASAAGENCGLEEHTHSIDDCYELTCTIPDGAQYGAHTHGEACSKKELVCDHADGEEHANECYTETLTCTLDEGENVLLSEHSHVIDCYKLTCEKEEHTHAAACYARAVSDGDAKAVSESDAKAVSDGDAKDESDDTGSDSNHVSVKVGYKRTYDEGNYAGFYDGSEHYVPRDGNTLVWELYYITIPADSQIGKLKVYVPFADLGDDWGPFNSGIDKDGNATSKFTFDKGLDTPIYEPEYSEFTAYYGKVDDTGLNNNSTIYDIADAIKDGSFYTEIQYSNSSNMYCLDFNYPTPGKTYEIKMWTGINGGNAASIGNAIKFDIFCCEYIKDGFSYYENWYVGGTTAEKAVIPDTSGRVWEDINGNGLQDEGEPGIAGVEVSYSQKSGTVTTDENGYYLITGIKNNRTNDPATIKITPDSDKYVLSPKDAGKDTLDSDAEMSGSDAVVSDYYAYHDHPDGYPTMNGDHIGFGLVPYVDVNYNWVGNAPASAKLPDSAEDILSGSEYTAEKVSDVPNYTFDGWYTDEACTKKFADGDQIIGDTDFYGKWTHNTITVSGSKTWENVPSGYTVPDVTVELMLDGKAVDTAVIASGKNTYSFSGLDRYAADGTELEYSVKEKAVTNFTASYSAAKTDADGNIVIDITNKGDFTYGTLTITNKVTGDKADTSLKFPFKVEFSTGGSYTCTITEKTRSVRTITVKSGDTIELKHGDTAVISGLVAGTSYTVTETNTKNYKMTSSGATGTIAESGSTAAFTNEKVDANGPKTGDSVNAALTALYVLQTAIGAALVCVFCVKSMKRRNDVA